jgi:hypothetical protein
MPILTANATAHLFNSVSRRLNKAPSIALLHIPNIHIKLVYRSRTFSLQTAFRSLIPTAVFHLPPTNGNFNACTKHRPNPMIERRNNVAKGNKQMLGVGLTFCTYQASTSKPSSENSVARTVLLENCLPARVLIAVCAFSASSYLM